MADVYGIKEKALQDYNKDFPIQLKKSILQEAVQGKLVLQDPADEPASVLLGRIRAEKEQLIKAGKIKRESKRTNRNPSFSEGIILIMKSVVLRSCALMMIFHLTFRITGCGLVCKIYAV